MKAATRICAIAALLALASCGLSKEDFLADREEAAACVAGDSCVFAGANDCTCAAPVNAAKASEIDDEAKDVSCFGEGEVECPYTVSSEAICVDDKCQAAHPVD